MKKAALDCNVCDDFKTNILTKSFNPHKNLHNSTWTFLHTLAAYYPINPTEEKQEHASNLMTCIAHLYPCTHCASHLEGYIKTHPVEAESRSKLVGWMCDMHNNVNQRLGKPVFDCKIASDFWRSVKN